MIGKIKERKEDGRKIEQKIRKKRKERIREKREGNRIEEENRR